MSYRSPILSGPSSPPGSRQSYSRRGSGSQVGSVDSNHENNNNDNGSPAISGLTIREKGRLMEAEEALRRRGNEPSLSYIAVVSGDQQVSQMFHQSFESKFVI